MDERLQELLAINRAIAGTLDYEELLRLIVDKTAQLSGAGVCALLLADDGGTARVEAWRGLPDERARAFAAPFDERIQSALAELLGHRAGDGFLGVPVIRRGEVTGMLVVHHEGAAPADPEQEELLAALADQAAISLDHAGRYRALWEESQAARRQLEAAADRKDEFLAMLSHELRNPLAAIVNAVSVLERRLADDPQLARIQKLASRQAMHMKRLLDDLLDVSRVSRGKIVLDRRRVPVQQIVRQAVEATQHLYEGREDTLTVEVPDEPLLVHGDPDRLAQVVANLLTNAAKYSQDTDPVRVVVARRGGAAGGKAGGTDWAGGERGADPAGSVQGAHGGGAGEVELRVEDGGEGLPPELLDAVFDLFVQSERGKDRRQGGLGIGLTLVRRLIELHGGSVEARSEGLGKGARFVVRLPLAAPQEDAAAEAEPAADGAGMLRRVLLVEDNRDVALALAALLESQGHEVRVAADGEGALAQAADEAPDVLLVDIGLPGMDGYELARRLRAERDGSAPRLVALTGYGSDGDRVRAQEAGFDHHLVKPVSQEDLRRVLRPAGASHEVAAGVAGELEPGDLEAAE